MSWFQILQTAADKDGKAKVAKTLGLSRTAVSLVLAGKYTADTKNIAEKVMAVLGNVQCPFLEKEIPMPTCQAYRERQVPTSSSRQVQHWQACYKCKAPDGLVPSGSDD